MLNSDFVRPMSRFSCRSFLAASVSSIFLNLYLQKSGGDNIKLQNTSVCRKWKGIMGHHHTLSIFLFTFFFFFQREDSYGVCPTGRNQIYQQRIRLMPTSKTHIFNTVKNKVNMKLQPEDDSSYMPRWCKGLLNGKLNLCNPSSPLSRAFFWVSPFHLKRNNPIVHRLNISYYAFSSA